MKITNQDDALCCFSKVRAFTLYYNYLRGEKTPLKDDSMTQGPAFDPTQVCADQ